MALVNPIQINDLESQKTLWDRRLISKTLKDNGIPTPHNFIVNRESQPEITQEYLESMEEANKDRGEQLIKLAEEVQKEFDESSNSAVSQY
mmetsp:Transcript_14034/g.21858  ORF Transcript_14034/g.21858 Transcript_14034/m.21858 type:complete len:91 (-) Transcript_14034:1288-1560(-)